MTVDGQGAKLVFGFRDNFRPLLTVRRAERFLLKDLSIDWNWGVYRIATLMRTINYEERNGKANWTLEMPDVEDFDINTIYNWDSAFALDIDSLTPGLAGVNDIWDLPVTRVTKLSANRIRLGLGGPLAVRPRAGTVWLVRHFGYEIHAMWIEACMHCTLDGVTVYSAPGMALTFEDESGNIAIKNFNIGVLPNSARQISSATDGIHLAGTKGEILIENVTIANQYDDCININDPVSVGFRILDKNTILATDWRNGRIVYKAGDTVAFRNADYSDSGVSAVVESATYQDGGWKIRLTTALPKFQGQTSKMFVLNTSRYSARNVIIRGLFCHSTRARGVVLQATNSVIEQVG